MSIVPTFARMSCVVIDTEKDILKSIFSDSAKSIGFGLVWILAACLFWYLLAGNPLRELALIRHGMTVCGTIVDADEEPPDDGGSWAHWLVYEYSIDGIKFTETITESGRLPRGFTLPCPIEVEYLPHKPTVSRIKGTGHASIRNWLLFRVGLGGLLLAFFVYPGVNLVYKGVRDIRCLREYKNLLRLCLRRSCESADR